MKQGYTYGLRVTNKREQAIIAAQLARSIALARYTFIQLTLVMLLALNIRQKTTALLHFADRSTAC